MWDGGCGCYGRRYQPRTRHKQEAKAQEAEQKATDLVRAGQLEKQARKLSTIFQQKTRLATIRHLGINGRTEGFQYYPMVQRYR